MPVLIGPLFGFAVADLDDFYNHGLTQSHRLRARLRLETFEGNKPVVDQLQKANGHRWKIELLEVSPVGLFFSSLYVKSCFLTRITIIYGRFGHYKTFQDATLPVQIHPKSPTNTCLMPMPDF